MRGRALAREAVVMERQQQEGAESSALLLDGFCFKNLYFSFTFGCARVFSGCGARGSSGSRARGPQSPGAGVEEHAFICSTACGIFPDQGLNWWPLHCKADLQPLDHTGKFRVFVFFKAYLFI